MKVTYTMMDRELRWRGKLLGLLLGTSSEAKFVKTMLNRKKQSDKRKGSHMEGLNVREEWITRKDGSKLRILIYEPHHTNEEVPGILWLHGGGYAMGVPEMFENTYKKLMDTSSCVIIAPDYRLSIEAPYPAALEDSYDALLWMKNHARELSIRSNQLMVGGESAGGGLTAALTLYARDKGEVNIAFQMPLYPMIDDRMMTESAKENNAPIWNSDMNQWAWKLYLGDRYGKEVSPYAAATRATDYTHLPPTVTYVGDLEPFRDETIHYVEKLKQAGVPVDFELYQGCYHGFDIINPKAAVSQKAVAFFLQSYQYAVSHYFAEQK
ncbi:acetyl esterase/lipase [Paenibacillus sp. LBL]|uniref:alpha/beta hydrolase n=1 Tax=Paenibacillus sp. LBL TaxID=2940563 RepID=UPI0024770EDB|nr:alpha/beta hydrolase [Paenibacillus sp. LBL]MDH6675124.1 acetyl esterase/lipase [Paenibacillus sp. LBL]